MDIAALEQFNLPPEAMEFFKSQPSNTVNLEDGVSRLMSGHDQGVAYRFFIHTPINEKKSELAGYDVHDEIECIEWLVDRRTKPTARVKHLPEELLRWNRYGELVSGRYKDAYETWKEGRQVPGLSLSKWGILSDGEVATLNGMNIFSVEQFAETDRSKIEGRLPESFTKAFEQAIRYVNGKDIQAQNSVQVEKMSEMSTEIAKLKAELERRDAMPAPRKRKRRTKAEMEESRA